MPAKKSAKAKTKVDCEHCKGVGKCTFGDLYNQDRHMTIFSDNRLTSCDKCLEVSGKKPNSKKLVKCSFCDGTGEVESG